MDNSQLIKNHKQQVADTFNRIASGYDSPALRYFPFSADYLGRLIDPKPGDRVLDVATGTGAVAISLAPHILPGGRVQAIDISDNMLDKALFNIQKHALDNIDLHYMDAENLEFRNDYFDIVCASFVLFFLPDPARALKQWHRVMKPGARLCFTSFSHSAFQPMLAMFEKTMQTFGIDVPSQLWMKYSDREACEAALDPALFSNIQSLEKQHGFHLASENDWWEFLYNSAFRALLEQLDARQLNEFRNIHLAEIASLKRADGIWMDVNVIYTQACRRE